MIKRWLTWAIVLLLIIALFLFWEWPRTQSLIVADGPVRQIEQATASQTVLAKPDEGSEDAMEGERSESVSDADSIEGELSSKEQHARDQCRRRLVDWLEPRGDARSLLTAAVLTMGSTSSPKREQAFRAQQLVDQAIALESGDAALRSFAISVCMGIPNCKVAEHEEALQSIDPKNAAAWMGEFARATDKSEQELDDALRSMAKAQRFDIYWLEIGARVGRAIDAAPVAPPSGVMECTSTLNAAALDVQAALTIPSFTPLVEHCKPPMPAERLLGCRQVGDALVYGDTVIASAIGYAIRRNLNLPYRDSEWRKFRWQLDRYRALEVFEQNDEARLRAEHRRELDFIQAALRERGIPLEPPLDWQPN